MKLTFSQLKSFQLPLKRSLSIRPGQSIEYRDLALCGFRSDEGKIFVGEIAPLLGLHNETLSQAISQFEYLRNVIAPEGSLVIDFEKKAPEWTKPFFGFFRFDEAYPSVLCAMEQVIWSAYHFEAKTRFNSQVDIAGFISDPLAKDIDIQALQGLSAIKIKIGRANFDQEINAISNIRRKLSPMTALRLDPNQSLSVDQFKLLTNLQKELGIDYLEEPFVSAEEYVYQVKNLPIALDESIYERKPSPIDDKLYLSLKPSRIGLSATIAWAGMLKDPARQLVLSSSYESGIGTKYLIELSSFLGVKKALGIGTYLQLKRDVLNPQLMLRFGMNKLDLELFSIDDW